MRAFLDELKRKGKLKEQEVKLEEVASILKQNPEQAFLFNIGGYKFRLASGCCGSRDKIADALKCAEKSLLKKIADSHSGKGKITEASKPACFQNSEKPDLSKLPIPILYKGMARYLTAGVVAAVDKEYGPNLSFHRLMVKGKDRLTARICERDTFKYLEKAGELDIAICMGLPTSVLIAAATSLPIEKNEYEIASKLAPLDIAYTKKGIPVPATSEIILEGKLLSEKGSEGPFVDLTGTYDIVRQQPVVKLEKMHCRDNPILHVIVPALPEHALLMGMPREPAIYNAVSKVSDCRGVALVPGGCSWLHGVVGIKKRSEDEIPKIVEAAFGAHTSMKHLFIVDDDINPADFRQVEWAMATRFQADKKLTVLPRARGSSLDPSIKEGKSSKAAFDCTIPLKKERKSFLKV